MCRNLPGPDTPILSERYSEPTDNDKHNRHALRQENRKDPENDTTRRGCPGGW